MRTSLRRSVALVTAAVVASGIAVFSSHGAKAAPTLQNLVVTGTGPGGGPHVKLFTTDGVERSSFFAYDAGFRGGVNVAIGDLDGDGLVEIITGAGPGGGPHVRIFTEDGSPIDGFSFFPYSTAFTGGVNVGVTDIDGDGDDEILTAPASGGGPHVKVIDVSETGVSLVREFFAFDTTFLGGVSVAGAYVDTSDNQGIVVGAGPGGGPHVKTFRADTGFVGGWFAYDAAYRGGVEVGSWFANDDKVAEIATASAAGPGHVRGFDVFGAPGAVNFFALPGTDRGADIASIEGEANGPFVVGPFLGVGPNSVGSRTAAGVASFSVNPYPGFTGGVRVAAALGVYDSNPGVTTTSSISSTSTSTSSTTTSSPSTSTTSTTSSG